MSTILTPAPKAAAIPPLLTSLVQEHGAQWVDAGSLAAWQAQAGDGVLLIAGDAVRFPEGLDVAVVLPQLKAAAGRPLHMAVARPEAEDEIAQRFGAQRRPSLVFLRDGRYVSTVAGMHDWTDFVALVRRALDTPAGFAPIGIAVDGARGPDASCH